MSKRNMLVFFFLSALVLDATRTRAQDASEPLPIDPQVTLKTLENGLRYYIRVNQEPANRAQFWLVVNAGSVLEDEDQQGLAHFLEHLAFNSTENFPDEQIIPFLQSIGLEFGADLNAGTNFDFTVYFLPVPTDDGEVVETTLQILEDWAHKITFDAGEIEEERAIVLEETRLRGDAFERTLNQLFSQMLAGSRYAERFPKGQEAVIENFDHEALERFFRDWYQPESMAVVAVGDFDPSRIEELIQQHFAAIPNDPTARQRPPTPVPDHEETRFGVVSDPELPFPILQISYKRDLAEKGTVGAFRRALAQALFASMFTARLEEAATAPEAPFLFPGFVADRVQTKELAILFALPGEQGFEAALEGMLTEIERVVRFGFTRSELERQKIALLSLIEQAFREKDTTPSADFAAEYMNHFLYGDSIPGIEYEWELARQLIPQIGLEEVAAAARGTLTEHNRVIGAAFPETPDAPIPGEEALRAVLDRIGEKEIEAYAEEDLTDLPLVARIPTPSAVETERTVSELGVTEWVLANGVRVVLKPTDFQSDEILFTAFSPGGHSLAPDADYVAAQTAASVVAEAGVGTFNRIDLEKKLTGQVVFARPWIDELQEGLSGSASPRDAETLFQLIHLYFTAPRQDELAFLALQSQQRSLLENAGADPVQAFFDTIQATLTQNHLRRRPFSLELVEEMDLEKSLAFYRDRFGDAGDFTFVFVGNLDLEQLRPLIETYLGGLPAAGRQESGRDVGVRPPRGVIQKTVRRGLAERNQAWVVLVFTGPFEWAQQNRFDFHALVQLLDIRTIDVLRQELGEIYTGGAGGFASRFPAGAYELGLSFPTAPESVNPLAAVLLELIDDLKSAGPAAEDLVKVREQLRQNREEDLEDNGFWLDALESAYADGDEPLDILRGDELIDGMTAAALQQAAQRYLDTGNYLKVVLLPEGLPEDTAVLEQYDDLVPQSFVLEQNIPNPFNSGTLIHFSLPIDAEVELAVYNLAGQKVVTLAAGERPAGIYSVHWDGRDDADRELASGLYLYRLQAGEKVERRKLLLLR